MFAQRHLGVQVSPANQSDWTSAIGDDTSGGYFAIAEEAPVIAEDAGYYSKPGGVVMVDETNVPTAVSDTTPSELAEVAASEFTFQAQKESLP